MNFILLYVNYKITNFFLKICKKHLLFLKEPPNDPQNLRDCINVSDITTFNYF